MLCVMNKPFMLNVAMLSVILASVIIPSVLAPLLVFASFDIVMEQNLITFQRKKQMFIKMLFYSNVIMLCDIILKVIAPKLKLRSCSKLDRLKK